MFSNKLSELQLAELESQINQMLCPCLTDLNEMLETTISACYEPDVLIREYNDKLTPMMAAAASEALANLAKLTKETNKVEATIATRIVVAFTNYLVRFSKYCWRRNTYIPELLDELNVIIEKFDSLRPYFTKSEKLQFLNIRLYDISIARGACYIANNQLKEGEICFLNALSKAIYYTIPKNSC
jgi:predicted nucleotide-binding protein (sugar kinase/HSP70/actin superfamily)